MVQPGEKESRDLFCGLTEETAYEERDSLTGLYRGGQFFEKVEQLLKSNSNLEYEMIAIDIEHLKLFNDWYGEEAGNRFLINIGNCLKEKENGCGAVAGYMGGDDFAIVLSKDISIVGDLQKEIKNYVKQFGLNVGFLPTFGIYSVDDRNLSASMMYDRSVLALNSVKGSYTNRVGRYDDSMRTKMKDDQVLLSEVQRALENQEFVFYGQPQCNTLTGKIVGIECLVRWNHPVRGLVSPGAFLPLLESNGLITNLDLYMWEMVCDWLHKWIESGHRPIPVSVNVSRMDIYAIDVVEIFTQLAADYHVDPKLLEIEITESAYAEDYMLIRKVVDGLRSAGFPVLMDDFGSGYSSLNMLKDVNVDVIKIDTKFLDMTENSQSRGMGIFETVVRMAHMMQLCVIAEGVEKKEQADFLQNVGCIYCQGYYYYRPMPIAEFEKILLNKDNVDYRGIKARKMVKLCLEDLFNRDVTSETMLNNMLGGVALYEVCGSDCQLLCVNEEYYRITGGNPVDLDERKLMILKQIHPDDAVLFLDTFKRAKENPWNGAEEVVRRYRLSGEVMWLRLRVFFIRERDGHSLYYGAISDATSQKKQEELLASSQKMLEDVLKLTGGQAPIENMAQNNQMAACTLFSQMAPAGLIGLYCEEGFPLYFANREMVQLLGYNSYTEFEEHVGNRVITAIHPDDIELVKTEIGEEYYPGREYTAKFRLLKKDKNSIWVINRGRMVRTEDDRMAIISVCMDINSEVAAKQKLEEENNALRKRNRELAAALSRLTEESQRKSEPGVSRPLVADFSTGIYSRKTVIPIMEQWIGRKRNRQSALVLFHFTHDGDRTFKADFERLKGFFREEDIMCRIGSDEIMILCKSIISSNMDKKMQQVMECMSQMEKPDGTSQPIFISAGYVMIPGSSTDFDKLYKHVRYALSKAKTLTKTSGHGNYVKYDKD